MRPQKIQTPTVAPCRRINGSLRTAFSLLCWEGAFASAYEALTGTGYLSGLAGEAHLEIPTLALLTTLPFVGAVGPLLGLFIVSKFQSLRQFTIVFATFARTLWSVPLLLAAVWAFRLEFHGTPFPVTRWFSILALCSGTSAFFAGAAGMSWNSWMHSLIPTGVRGRFFGSKQFYGVVALIFSNTVAVLLAKWQPGGYFIGYGLLGSIALICGAASTWLLSRVPTSLVEELRVTSLKPHLGKDVGSVLADALSDRDFLPVLVFGAVFSGSLQMASPYFNYYFTRDLHVPMSSIIFWTLLANIGAFTSAKLWGRRIDQIGDIHNIISKAGFFVALSPLYYVFLNSQNIYWVAPLEYFVSGVAGSGFALATSSLLYGRTPVNRVIPYFAIYSALVGLAGACGSMIGAQLSQWFTSLGGFRLLWIVATSARLMTIGLASGLFFRESRVQTKAKLYSISSQKKTHTAASQHSKPSNEKDDVLENAA